MASSLQHHGGHHVGVSVVSHLRTDSLDDEDDEYERLEAVERLAPMHGGSAAAAAAVGAGKNGAEFARQVSNSSK